MSEGGRPITKSRSFEGSVGKSSGEALRHVRVRSRDFESNALVETIIAKEGSLAKREKSVVNIANWKTKRFVLNRGSLYYYSLKQNRHMPKGVIHLQGCILLQELPEKKIKRKNVFALQSTDKTEWILSADSEQEKLEWVKAITENLALPPAGPPDLNILKRRTSTVKEDIIDQMTSFGPSRRVIKEFVTEESFQIIEALTSFISQFESMEKAQWVEKSILSVGMKLAILYRDKKISKSVLLVIQEPMRSLCDRLIDAYEMPFTFSRSEVMDLGRDCKDVVLMVLHPYLDEKTFQAVEDLFEYFLSDKLVVDFFSKKKWKETAVIGTTLRNLWDAGRL